MEQPIQPNPPHKHKKSRVCCFIEVVILLVILSALAVGLVYYFGTEQLHNDVPHALDQIFSTTPHKDLISNLNKKSYQHSIIYGNNETGIFEFLEHYADLRANKGGLVVLKRVQNNFYQTALKFIRYTKQYIEENIKLQGQLQKVEWIFLVKNDQIPLQQIQRIKTKRTKDRIIIGVTTKPTNSNAIKGFKKVQFPAVPLKVVQQVISGDFGVTLKTAEILTSYYGTIPAILTHLNQISFTNQKHLGQNYRNIKDLSKVQLKTLTNLCKNGIAPLDGNRAALEQIGVVAYDGNVYWENRINRLNYQLSLQVQCVDKTVPQDIKVKIAKQREEQSKAQIQGSNEQEVVEQTKPVPKPTKEVKKSKKSKTQAKTKTQQPKVETPKEQQPKVQVKKVKKQKGKTKQSKVQVSNKEQEPLKEQQPKAQIPKQVKKAKKSTKSSEKSKVKKTQQL